MARIRSLKPEFFTDSQMVALTAYARLLYQGMWCHADEWGVLEDDPMQLKMRVLPGDPVDVAELLDELLKAGRVRRAVTPDGTNVLVISRFRKHQRPDGRLTPRWALPETFTYTSDHVATRSDMSAPTAESASDLHVQTSRDMSQPVVTGGEGQGSGVRGQGSGDRDAPADADSPPKRKRATQLPDGWQPNDGHHELARAERVDITRERAKFCDHHAAKGSTFKDWDRAFSSWLRKAGEWSAKPRGRPAHAASDVTDAQRHDRSEWK